MAMGTAVVNDDGDSRDDEGRCEARMLVVALGRGQGAGRRRVSDGGWQKRRATHLWDLPLVGTSLNSSSPGIHHYGGRHGLMGVGIGREDPSSGQYTNKYDAQHDKDNGGLVSGASTMEMMMTATSAGHPGA
ncbi:hypothetical protein BJ912DRAFT_1043536 [Pholiota molesta]|nr:hypothetical protein BJ912DRAFT_1043536 [Pholiota molesta]